MKLSKWLVGALACLPSWASGINKLEKVKSLSDKNFCHLLVMHDWIVPVRVQTINASWPSAKVIFRFCSSSDLFVPWQYSWCPQCLVASEEGASASCNILCIVDFELLPGLLWQLLWPCMKPPKQSQRPDHHILWMKIHITCWQTLWIAV